MTQHRTVETSGMLTSPVQTDAGLVVAGGRSVLALADDGSQTPLAPIDGQVWNIQPVEGGLAYLQKAVDGDQTRAMFTRTVDSAGSAGVVSEPLELAVGPVGEIGLVAGPGEQVYVVAPAVDVDSLPAGLEHISGLRPETTLSTEGQLAVDEAFAPTPVAAPGQASVEIVVNAAVVGGESLEFEFSVDSAEGNPTAEQPDLPTDGESTVADAAAETAAGSSTVSAFSMTPGDAWTSGSLCAVGRNNPQHQALQPRPAQVEWAVNQAVRGNLTGQRGANWMNLGMPTYSPQGLFPRPALAGGGEVPSQILLGVLAQESNLWQASRFTVPGVTGNPLIGNYYGVDRNSGAANAWWQIDYFSARYPIRVIIRSV